MADDLNSDTKENMNIRQNLVDTAVSFLLNPNVAQRPDDAKIAFLKKKGLTDSEIDESFSRVKNEAVVSNDDQQFLNAYPLPPYRTSNSFWFYLRSYSSALVSFAVAGYVLHRLYKIYIEPWLFGSKSEQSELSALKHQLLELNNSVSKLTSSVASLEETVNNQKHQMDSCYLYDVESVPKSVRDILDEVSNVKGLLLNRFSFPAPPALMSDNKTQNDDSPKVVSIPKWQLRDSELAKSKETEEKENSSLESTPLENNFSSVENNKKINKDTLQDEKCSATLGDKNENPKACLENNSAAKDKIQEEDSKIPVQNGDLGEKTMDEDFSVESDNYLSDSETTEQTTETNELHGST